MEEFDDGSGTVPEFMDGRKMVTDGELEDHMRPLPFITVPIMRSKGLRTTPAISWRAVS